MNCYPLPKPIISTLDELVKIDIVPCFAQDDLKAVYDFLKKYAGNKDTFSSYRREIERLLQWAWLVAEKSILHLTKNHIQEYIVFCLKPPKSWIGTKRVSRFIERDDMKIANPSWRPFVATVNKSDYNEGKKPDKNNYRLSQKAINDIYAVLGSFYNYLLLKERVFSNPVTLSRKKTRSPKKNQSNLNSKCMTEKQWGYCLETAEQMASENSKQHERTLFIINVFYLLYLHIPEIAANKHWVPQMKHFHQDDDHQYWWFKITNKDNEVRKIAVCDGMLNALKRYRQRMGLSPLPSHRDSKPLFPKEKGKGAITSTQHIRRIVQDCFNRTVERLKKIGFINDANILEEVTAQWLRQTGLKAIRVDINAATQSGNTALILAAYNGRTAAVQALLAVPGINVNAADQFGYTALICAAANGHTAAVQALLAVPGINVNAANQYGGTALIRAAINGHTAAVQALLAVPGINVNAAGQFGYTALIWAAANGDTAAVQALLAVPGINVNAANQSGNTALICAADNGRTAAVRAMLAIH